ncbi:hypothetical protein BH11ACT8_BH11ACT8_19850 [soil metagenome]
MSQRPTSVTRAVQLVWLLVLVGAGVTVLASIFDEDLVTAWAGGQGRSADDTRVPPSFTPVLVVLFVVVSSLLLVLMSFLRNGHNWARHCLGGAMILVAVAIVAGIGTSPPTVFLLAAIGALVIDAVLLVCLYLPSTSAYVGRLPRTSTTPTRV